MSTSHWTTAGSTFRGVTGALLRVVSVRRTEYCSIFCVSLMTVRDHWAAVRGQSVRCNLLGKYVYENDGKLIWILRL